MVSATITQITAAISIADIFIIAVTATSMSIMTMWLLTQSGPLALADAPPRRNRIPLFLPFLLLTLWIFLAYLAITVNTSIMRDSSEQTIEFAAYLVTALVEILLIATTLVLAWALFARRIRGFGLNFKTLPGDIPPAIVNFIAILPFVWLGIIAVDFFGKLVAGEQFELKPNQALDSLTQNPQLAMRIMMLSFTLVVVPIFEELLFRGLMQSMARAWLNSPWAAILLTSLIFALMHPMQHWPAIFILSLAIGYSYEKSGSLFRPIIIHILFNTTNVFAALLAN